MGYILFICGGYATAWPVSAVEAILQINGGLSYQIICTEAIIIHHLDPHHGVHRKYHVELKQPRGGKKTSNFNMKRDKYSGNSATT